MRDVYKALSVLFIGSASFLFGGCGALPGDGATTQVAGSIKGGDHGDFQITSPAFDDGAPIPDENTCNGKPFGSGTSPVLEWANAPQHTMSFAIVFKDTSLTTAVPPDNRGWHWAIWDIQKNTNSLPAGLASTEFLDDPRTARQWSRYSPYGYLGPCPNFDPTVPVHTDHYSFVIYAVDTKILDYPAPDPTIPNYTRVLDQFLAANAIASAELHGTAAAVPSAPPVPPGPPPAPSPRP
jgi:Raf kinase inhibitor-like YbhB/YbcL family protein